LSKKKINCFLVGSVHHFCKCAKKECSNWC
jgi:hypothetical protein